LLAQSAVLGLEGLDHRLRVTIDPSGKHVEKKLKVQEVASAAVFLSSPVSSFTTGINMVVDGAISTRVNF
jgi:enoyl-[acyl-carrier-protein] reductase (NADH)